MSGICMPIVWNVVLASALAMIVAGAGVLRFMRDRPALRHSLWLLVLFKLATPPLIPLPILPPQLSDNDATVASGASRVGASIEARGRENENNSRLGLGPW